MECTSIGESGPHVLPGFLRGDVGYKEGMISYNTKELQTKIKMSFITRCIPQHKKLKVFPTSATSQEANLVVSYKHSLDAKGNCATGMTAGLVCSEVAWQTSLTCSITVLCSTTNVRVSKTLSQTPDVV